MKDLIKDKKICVLGLGYIGLPTASILATHGFEVVGVDVNSQIINIINNGDIHIKENGLKTIVSAAIKSGKLRVASSPEKSDVFIIAVPTPLKNGKQPDLTYVEAACESICPFLAKGNLVVLESTSPPGTTKNLVARKLEESGLKASEDFYVAYCPERVLPSKILIELVQNNRIIGGIDEASTEKAVEIYSTFVEGEICKTDSTTAEMVKLMENIYRDVNIALANELAIICTKIGINAWEVIELANQHPRVNLHYPGPGVGGHCLAIDPWYIVNYFQNDAKLISVSRNINDSMPYYVTDTLMEILKVVFEKVSKPKVTVLGVSYKANVDDIRESPSLTVIKLLNEKGIDVSIYDPHVRYFPYEIVSITEAIRDSDCLLIMVNHDEFKFLNPSEIGVLMRHKIIFDAKNCIKHNVWKAYGFDVHLIGASSISNI